MPDFSIEQAPQEQTPVSGDFSNSRATPLTIIAPAAQNNYVDTRSPATIALDNNRSSAFSKSQNFFAPVVTSAFTDDNAKYAGNFDALNPNMETEFAARQSLTTVLGNRLAKFGATAGVTFLDTFMSLGGLAAGDSPESSDVITEQQRWLNKLEIEFPNYQSQAQKDHPFLSYFNPLNFKSFVDNWGGVAQQLAFTVGSIGAAAVIDIPLGLVSGGILDAVVLPRQLEKVFAGVGRMSRLMAEKGEGLKAFTATINESDDVLRGINAALGTASKVKTATDMGRFAGGAMISAYGEAVVQGNQSYIQVKKDLESKYLDEYGHYAGGNVTQDEINNAAKAAAKAQIAPNVAFLTISNMLGYSAFLKPGAAAIQATEKALAGQARVTLGGNMDVFNVAREKLSKRLLSSTSTIAANSREALEEAYQYVVQDSYQNYYEKRFNNKANADTISLASEMSDSVGRLFGTTEGLMNPFMGFMSGFLQHGIKLGYGKMTGVKSGSQIAGDITTNLNQYKVSDLIAMNEAVTNVDIFNNMKEALKNKDLFTVKNLRFDHLFNLVNSGVSANKFEARLEQLDALKNMNDENFSFYFQGEATEDNKKTVAQYVDSIKAKAIEIKDTITKVNHVFGENPFSEKNERDNFESFNAYKAELSYNLSAQKEQQRRVVDISNEIAKTASTANIEDLVNLTSEDGVKTTIENFGKRIKDLQESMDLVTGNKTLSDSYKVEKDFLERKSKELTTLLEMGELHTKDFLGTFNDIHNYYNNLNTVGKNSINSMDSLLLFNRSQDINNLQRLNTSTVEMYKALATKEGFGEFQTKYIKARNAYNSFLTNNITFDEAGKMVIIPETTTDLEDTLDVDDPQGELERLETANAEEIAKVMNPNYENEPESEEYKIAHGEVEVTPEVREAAKERVKEQQEAKKEAKAKTQSQSASKAAPANETPEERKKRRASEQDENATDGEIAAPKKESTPKSAVVKEDATVQPKTTMEKFWDGLLSPITMFFKVFSKGATEKFPIDYLGNLREAIFGTSSKEEVNALISKMTINVADSKTGKASTEFGTYPIKGKIYRKGQAKEVTLLVSGKPIGLLNEPDSLYYKDEKGEFKPLHEITSATLYEALTGNPAKTFENFQKEATAYREAYNKLINKDGDITNEELQKVFKILISYGSYDMVNTAEKATIINNLTYKPKGSAILSFPMIFNEEKDIYERQAFPTILNKDELTTAELADVAEFFEKYPKKAEELNSRYGYLVRMPDGTFSAQSFLVARPVNENAIDLDKFLKDLKLSITEAKNKEFNLKSINAYLGNALYVSHSKKNDNRKTHIRFSISGKDEHNLVFNIFNKKLGVSVRLFVTEEELNSLKTIDEFINYLNNRIKAKEQTNTPLKGLGIVINAQSFKRHLASDDKITAEELTAGLTVPVAPNVFKDYSVSLAPIGSERAKGKTTPSTPRTPKPENPIIAETKTKYATALQPIVEKRTGKKMSTDEVFNTVNADDVKALLNYYEQQREKQVQNFIKSKNNGNFSPDTSTWDSKIKDLRNYLKSINVAPAKKANVVSEAQMTNFVDKNIVSDDVLQDIAEKVMDGDKLTTEELAIFTGKTSEINAIIKEIKDAEDNLIDATSGSAQVVVKPVEEKIEPIASKYNLNEILSQLEAKGIIKKDCK